MEEIRNREKLSETCFFAESGSESPVFFNRFNVALVLKVVTFEVPVMLCFYDLFFSIGSFRFTVFYLFSPSNFATISM